MFSHSSGSTFASCKSFVSNLRTPVVNLRQRVACCVVLALLMPEASQVHSRSQFPGFCLLLTNNLNGFVKAHFGLGFGRWALGVGDLRLALTCFRLVFGVSLTCLRPVLDLPETCLRFVLTHSSLFISSPPAFSLYYFPTLYSSFLMEDTAVRSHEDCRDRRDTP